MTVPGMPRRRLAWRPPSSMLVGMHQTRDAALAWAVNIPFVPWQHLLQEAHVDHGQDQQRQHGQKHAENALEGLPAVPPHDHRVGVVATNGRGLARGRDGLGAGAGDLVHLDERLDVLWEDGAVDQFVKPGDEGQGNCIQHKVLE
eukprot:CAMPEP_0177169170 /NCGR_PEP_ID=MMETSP0367-20130122/9440_1 /TAXON_ID=447022 ORGANISM="Scrippsiella hangoei-like, Strain SHHI-4" /NCGR_SAMPLE_ID=MMETSP0367 /ASSEMBLY_ACC=CAM_ASM_000362 /LENGTH=144 /DNA_ID=CAMNT_0018615319 /DNA_START=57 /DNA_END=491 /DNA_ORIENTATION=-